MARKKYTPVEKVTEAVIKSREKRKWQIAYRRYVIEKQPTPAYAPFFGLDIENLRNWFEYQFTGDAKWENFGKSWQFEHIIPVTYFDFTKEDELLMCWNFTNIRVEIFQENKENAGRLDILAARNYFREIFEETQYGMCGKLLNKIEAIIASALMNTKAPRMFIREKQEYLNMIEGFGQYEFDMLNKGKSLEEVRKEMILIRKLGQ